MLRKAVVIGATTSGIGAAVCASLSTLVGETEPPESLRQAAAAKLGPDCYIDTFAAPVGQKKAMAKLAHCDGEGLARLLFSSVALAPESFVLQKLASTLSRHLDHVEPTMPDRFVEGSHFLAWRCTASDDHGVLMSWKQGYTYVGKLEGEPSYLLLGSAGPAAWRDNSLRTAIHRAYQRLLVLSMTSALVRRRMGEESAK